MASPLTTLGALWEETLEKPWSAVKVDGLSPVDSGKGYELRATAYWHSCPRCFATVPEAVGQARICGACGLGSVCRYRSVVVRLPQDMVVRNARDAVAALVARVALVAKGLSSMHPAHLEHETTLVDLNSWDWGARFADGKRWDSAYPERA